MVVEIKIKHLNRKTFTEIGNVKVKYSKRNDKKTGMEIFSGLKLTSKPQKMNISLERECRKRTQGLSFSSSLLCRMFLHSQYIWDCPLTFFSVSRHWGLYAGLFLGGIIGVIMILQVVILLLRRRGRCLTIKRCLSDYGKQGTSHHKHQLAISTSAFCREHLCKNST